MKTRTMRRAAGVPLAVAIAAISQAGWAQSGGLEEIVVTAQRITQSVNDIGMSISATSGDRLKELGVKDTSDLVKLVPGFNHTYTTYGTPVYSIRGVGFLETTLSSGPTVAIYSDEVPIPFSLMSKGVNLDVSRVEVLKGPQGTLYGLNSTGGAVNYITNRPTEEQEAGFNVSYGRFNEVDAEGYVSGPLTDDVRGRAALRLIRSDGWQESYTHGGELGEKDMLQGRVSLDWDITDRLRTQLTLSGWHDQGENPAPQFKDYFLRTPGNPIPTGFTDYERAPDDARAADWDPNEDHSNDNWLFSGSLRVDYDLTDNIVLTSLSSYQKYRRDQRLEGDGTTFENYYSEQTGKIKTLYQELRLTGAFNGEGNWIVGANFERDETYDSFNQYYDDATSAIAAGVYGPESNPVTWQDIDTYGIFANAEYPLSENLALQGGIRYTESDRDFQGCSRDLGNPDNPGWAGQSEAIQAFLRSLNGLSGFTPVPPGGCGTMGPGPEFEPGMVYDNLKEDNVSWRANLNWYVNPNTLFYGNVSQGFKAGSFPTLAIALSRQFEPVVQEELLAYEVGMKSTLLDGTLQLNAASFYYDYTDKQLLGSVLDPVFGPLPALVNVPKSNVVGFEVSAAWAPIEGLRINPSVSRQESVVEGSFVDFDSLGQEANFGGQSFPVAPEWQASVDAQYRWAIGDGMEAFIGGNLSYQDGTKAFFSGDVTANAGTLEPLAPGQIDPDLRIKSYTLLDMRAGIQRGPWEVALWGRNITDEYYWNNVSFAADSIVRYAAMPRTYGISVRYDSL